MKHVKIMNLCGGKLHFTPIRLHSRNIIDLGTGTGIWCKDMGDEYPSAQSLGVDLTVRVPPNAKFMVDHVELDQVFG
jgi:trans-aconitate methyltransferase